MPLPNLLSGNPFAQNNPLSKPLYSPAPKPTTTTVGGVSVNTTKPVIIAKPPVKQDTDTETGAGNEVVTNKNPKPGFWASKTKTQKTLIIISVIATASLMTYIALRKK